MAWFEDDPERFAAEVFLVRKDHPGCKVCKKDDQILIFDEFQTRRQSYLIKVIYPRSFPYSPPEAYVVDPPVRGTPHGGPKMCLFAAGEFRPEFSGSIVMTWAKKWLAAYERWKDTGHWPDSGSIQL